MLGLLFLLLLGSPFILMVVGAAMTASTRIDSRQKGRKLLQWGAILLAVEVLIGFAVCSKMFSR